MNPNLLFKYRVLLGGFIAGVVLAGATAFPLTWEIALLAKWLQNAPIQIPGLTAWVVRVSAGLTETDARFPFLAYGTDWLAFAHLMIAVAYIGPWREPARNRWILEWGLICCAGVIPLAIICGPIRGIPWVGRWWIARLASWARRCCGCCGAGRKSWSASNRSSHGDCASWRFRIIESCSFIVDAWFLTTKSTKNTKGHK